MPVRMLIATVYTVFIALACAIPARAADVPADDLNDPAIVIDLGDLSDGSDLADCSGDVRVVSADDSGDSVDSTDPADDSGDDSGDSGDDSSGEEADPCDATAVADEPAPAPRALKKTIRASRRSALSNGIVDAGYVTVPKGAHLSGRLKLSHSTASLGTFDRTVKRAGRVHVVISLSSAGKRALRKQPKARSARLTFKISGGGRRARTTTHSVSL